VQLLPQQPLISLDYHLKINHEKRVFIGIPIGCKIKSILSIVKSSINYNPSHIKWIPAENIHLTLLFLGNISNKDLPHLILSVEKKISSNNFQLTIKGTGVFPSSKSPKVLWLDLGIGVDELTSLQQQIKESVEIFNENYQEITFTPHITIAKIRRLGRKIDVLPFLNTVYSPIELEVNSIYLYESQLSPEGAQYTVLNAFPLN